MRHSYLPLALPAVAFLTLGLVSCGEAGTGGAEPDASSSASQGAAPAPSPVASADPLAAHDAAPGAPAQQYYPDPEKRPVMQAQVVLDRLGFTPGVVDGQMGLSTRNALRGFQMANDLNPTGEMDQPTLTLLGNAGASIPATRVVTIPADFAAGPFMRTPHDPQLQAQMPTLAYQSLDEKLAERFHTTLATLKQLNPDGAPAGLKSTSPAPQTSPTASASPSPTPSPTASDGPLPSMFHAGQQVRVPNVGNDAVAPGSVKDADWAATLASLGVASQQPAVDHLVVSKSKGTLMAYDAAGKIVAVYTATMGSQHDPLPLGEWKVQGVSHNPKFHYNPKLFWDAKPGSDKAMLPPGPNGPVGVVWIDLNIPHYGIHGTPEPSTIGRAESHGCVRLTNWDAARLAQMVRAGTRVTFEA